MKLKQIKLLLLSLLVVISSATGLVMSGVGTGNQTAKAYVCPGTGPAGEPLYEYHESDGKCWKINYKPTGTPPTAKFDPNTHIYACPDGSDPTFGSSHNQCKLTCASGDIYHSDDNTCYHWKQGDYVSQETQKEEPTLNNGQQLDGKNGHCTDGFQWVEKGGKDGPGCYDIVNGAPRCGKDQNADLNAGSRAGTSSYDCSESGHTHLVPNDPKQSADTTKAPVDGSAKTDCTGHGGLDTTTNKCKDGTEPVAAGGAGQAGNKDDSLSSCGEAQTVLISCDAGNNCTDASKTADTKTATTGSAVIGCVARYAIAALTVLVGIAAVGGIVWESLQYARAQDDQSIVSGAKSRIRDIVIGLVVYIFMVAIVNWLVPGGIIPG